MKQFFNIFLYELKMSLLRRSLWISFGFISLIFVLGLNTTSGDGLLNHLIGRDIFLEAAETVFTMNMFTPLLVGALAADRLQRDMEINLQELQTSTVTGLCKFIMAKFWGVVFSMVIVGLAASLFHGFVSILILDYPMEFLLAEIVVFIIMLGPAFMLITALSMGVPMVLPVRVYQILFTGYWVWGNLLTNRLLPTVSDTILNASGMFALQGIFGSSISPVGGPPHSFSEAVMNIFIIILMTGIALTATARLLQIKNANR